MPVVDIVVSVRLVRVMALFAQKSTLQSSFDGISAATEAKAIFTG